MGSLLKRSEVPMKHLGLGRLVATLGWGLAGLALSATVLLSFWGAIVFFDYLRVVVGPPPEEIQETCKPVLAWLDEQRAVHGEYPEALNSESVKVLRSLPYDWDYGSFEDDWGHESFGSQCTLTIGSSQWPGPFYSYYWHSRFGWQFSSDYAVGAQKTESILRRAGYYD